MVNYSSMTPKQREEYALKSKHENEVKYGKLKSYIGMVADLGNCGSKMWDTSSRTGYVSIVNTGDKILSGGTAW